MAKFCKHFSISKYGAVAYYEPSLYLPLPKAVLISFATYDIGCANDHFCFAKFILQEFGLCFFSQFFLFFDETFFYVFYVFDEICYLAKLHLANIIWRNFIWRTSFDEISFAEDWLHKSFPWRWFSNGWTDRHTHLLNYIIDCDPNFEKL